MRWIRAAGAARKRTGASDAQQVHGKVAKKEAVREQAPEQSTRSQIREYVEAFGMAILLALFIRTFIVQAFKIPSGSMEPTLAIGDHLLVNKFLYGIRVPVVGTRLLSFIKPERGDVIVFVYPEDRSKDFIKRIVAVEGDEIEVRNKVIYLNGEKAPDAHGYIAPGSRIYPNGARDNFGPYKVPDGHVFVMGDNRDHSHDSRYWGPVPVTDILGKAFILYWSWDSQSFRPRFSRIGMRIP